MTIASVVGTVAGTLRLRVLSDLHLLHHADGGVEFTNSLEPQGEDALVLAGDVFDSAGNEKRLRKQVERFLSKWERVLFVAGNHEYYRFGVGTVWKTLRKVEGEFEGRFVFLDNQMVEVKGRRILGGTGWFPFQNENWVYQSWIADFSQIKGFNPWVYEEHDRFKDFLQRELREGDIVVTHHLPTWQSVHPKYTIRQEHREMNRFFVGDVESIILERKPALWIHGHTHERTEYTTGSTRVIANPLGYPREGNYRFEPELIVEV